MNKFIAFGIGLSLVVPCQLYSLNKKKIKTAAKIIVGTVSAIGAGLIMYNITKTAQRRLANPNYVGPISISALLGQATSILAHNKGLLAVVASLFGVSAYCFTNGIKDFYYSAVEDHSINNLK